MLQIYNTYGFLFIDRNILSWFRKIMPKEIVMKKDVKKILASLGVASLISAGGITLPGAHAAGSG
jgi:radical SAM modification target selenobiotic family peptide